MNEVLSLNMSDDIEIRIELLNRLKERDYVPSKAENEYAEALLKEYKNRF